MHVNVDCDTLTLRRTSHAKSMLPGRLPFWFWLMVHLEVIIWQGLFLLVFYCRLFFSYSNVGKSQTQYRFPIQNGSESARKLLRLDFFPEHFISPGQAQRGVWVFGCLWVLFHLSVRTCAVGIPFAGSRRNWIAFRSISYDFLPTSLKIFYWLRMFLVALRYQTQISTSCAIFISPYPLVHAGIGLVFHKLLI